MRAILAALATVLALATALPATAAEPSTRYLTVVNRSHDSVTALSVSPTGASTTPQALKSALRGGGASTTVAVSAETCRHDVRVMFRNGRSQLYRDVDLCRQRALRLQPLPRLDGDSGERLAQASR